MSASVGADAVDGHGHGGDGQVPSSIEVEGVVYPWTDMDPVSREIFVSADFQRVFGNILRLRIDYRSRLATFDYLIRVMMVHKDRGLFAEEEIVNVCEMRNARAEALRLVQDTYRVKAWRYERIVLGAADYRKLLGEWQAVLEAVNERTRVISDNPDLADYFGSRHSYYMEVADVIDDQLRRVIEEDIDRATLDGLLDRAAEAEASMCADEDALEQEGEDVRDHLADAMETHSPSGYFVEPVQEADDNFALDMDEHNSPIPLDGYLDDQDADGYRVDGMDYEEKFAQ
ncbi:hypothetical protein [Mollivirus kamchatka]|nr:hypothetical protein [Mollivirus kamchatka]